MVSSSRPEKNTKKHSAKKRLPKKITASYLHNSGLYYLQRFTTSSENFRKVMIRKVDRSCYAHEDQSREDCIELVNELVKKFYDTGLLDDELYTQGMIISLRRRGLSTRVIHGRLRLKGITQDMIDKHIEETNERYGDYSDYRAALRLSKKRKIGPFFPEKNENNDKKKALAILARAGFSYEIANKALETSQEDAFETLNESDY